MARIRTIPKAVEEMRKTDPGTYINETALRRWVHEGRIGAFVSGRCILVDLDEIEGIAVQRYANC